MIKTQNYKHKNRRNPLHANVWYRLKSYVRKHKQIENIQILFSAKFDSMKIILLATIRSIRNALALKLNRLVNIFSRIIMFFVQKFAKFDGFRAELHEIA
jgi:hypothetical protein